MSASSFFFGLPAGGYGRAMRFRVVSIALFVDPHEQQVSGDVYGGNARQSA
jgi:hypothetical protein